MCLLRQNQPHYWLLNPLVQEEKHLRPFSLFAAHKQINRNKRTTQLLYPCYETVGLLIMSEIFLFYFFLLENRNLLSVATSSKTPRMSSKPSQPSNLFSCPFLPFFFLFVILFFSFLFLWFLKYSSDWFLWP